MLTGDGDGGDRSNLQADETVSDDNDDLPRPLLLVSDGDNRGSDGEDDAEGPQGGETHLGLADLAVAAGGEGGNPVTERTSGDEANEGTSEDCGKKVRISDWEIKASWGGEDAPARFV